MRTTKIVQIEISFRHELISIKGSPSNFAYYSNLTLTIDAIKEELLLNDWDLDGFNYTAVYRALKLKGVYVKIFKSKGTPFFRITISYKVLNPKLSSLEVIQNPI